MINSRNILDLTPDTAAKCTAFMQRCAKEGVPVLITSTYRDVESQNALYAQGRTKPGTVVTQVRGGDSFHQYRVAFDFVPLVDGKPVWSDTAKWERCGSIGQAVGLEWGGSWKRFRDMPHMQNTGGKTIADFKKGA